MYMCISNVFTKLLFLIFSFFMFVSCKKPESITGVTIDTYVDLFLKNSNGQNLLNPTTPGYFSSDQIRIYYIQNEKKVEVYNPNLDFPRGFKISKNEGNSEYFIRVFQNDVYVDKEKVTTYIQWRSDLEDTLQTQISKSNSSTIFTAKIWYNGKLKYDVDTSPTYVDWGNGQFRRLLEVIK